MIKRPRQGFDCTQRADDVVNRKVHAICPAPVVVSDIEKRNVSKGMIPRSRFAEGESCRAATRLRTQFDVDLGVIRGFPQFDKRPSFQLADAFFGHPHFLADLF